MHKTTSFLGLCGLSLIILAIGCGADLSTRSWINLPGLNGVTSTSAQAIFEGNAIIENKSNRPWTIRVVPQSGNVLIGEGKLPNPFTVQPNTTISLVYTPGSSGTFYFTDYIQITRNYRYEPRSFEIYIEGPSTPVWYTAIYFNEPPGSIIIKGDSWM